MNITILTVGKLKESYLKDGIAEYSKRLSRFATIHHVSVADEKTPDHASQADNLIILEKEADRLFTKIKDKDYVIALAIEGEQLSSERFAHKMDDIMTQGHADVTFVIGGSLGLSDRIKQRANLLISFGRLTLPHQLMRLVLVEQIYRVFMINHHTHYHK